jgi:Raf kinase inhibitor-like YbhB/YbcL family protein
LDNGAKQGTNDMGTIGYVGPSPPSGTHRYAFKIYALDTMLNLEPGATKQQVKKQWKVIYWLRLKSLKICT